MFRRQLPVYSPVRVSALIAALRAAWNKSDTDCQSLVRELARALSARHVVLTDSGTSALILSLRLVAGRGGTVAFPGYACIDLAAAARYAGVRARLYDLDPATLSPDLDSVARTLERGAVAIVVAHLYGFPADIPGVMKLASAHGASVIEDAAQGGGGTLHGRSLGSFGGLTILSFGRGKGVTGGGGGALLAFSAEAAERLESIDRPQRIGAGWRNLALVTAQWTLGRPRLYAIPSAIPGLRLGEMVFRPAHEPRPMSSAAAALVRASLSAAEAEVATRRRNAAALVDAVRHGDGLAPVGPVTGGVPGYLRFPIRDLRRRPEVSRLGLVRGYPRTLAEEPELRPCLWPNEPPPSGAAELRRSLFTLPVHRFVTRRDVQGLKAWLDAD